MDALDLSILGEIRNVMLSVQFSMQFTRVFTPAGSQWKFPAAIGCTGGGHRSLPERVWLVGATCHTQQFQCKLYSVK